MNLNSLLCFYVVIVVIFGFEPLGGFGLWPGNASMKQHADAGWCGTAIASQQPTTAVTLVIPVRRKNSRFWEVIKIVQVQNQPLISSSESMQKP
jgi:hypothetical protein